MTIALLLTLLAAQAASPTNELDPAALEALARGDVRTAEGLLQAQIDEPAARCLLGELAAARGDHNRAAALLSKVPKKAFCHGRAQFVLAEGLLAQGQSTAAMKRYDGLAAVRMGPERGSFLASNLNEEAGRLLTGQPDPAGAAALLETALQLPLSEKQTRTLALRLAAIKPHSAIIAQALTPYSDPQDAVRIARASGAGEALTLLSDVPDGVERNLAWSEALLNQGTPWLAFEYIRAHEVAGLTQRVVEALPRSLDVLRWAVRQPDSPSDLEQRLLSAAASIGHSTTGALIDEHLARHPEAEGQPWFEKIRLDWIRANHTGSPEAYCNALETVAGEQARVAHFECGLAHYQAESLEAAEKAWRQDLDSYGSIDTLRGIYTVVAATKGRDPALTTLMQLSTGSHERFARQVEADARAEALSIRTDPNKGTVMLRSANLAAVQLRVHRIDAEAYLRGGGTASGVSQLDVGIVPADREWSVRIDPVEAGFQWTEVDVVKKPGLYVVTASADRIEASSTLVHGSLGVVAEEQHGSLVLYTSRNGEPVSAQVSMRMGDDLRVVRSDGSGLARIELTEPISSPLTVLVESRGEVLLADLALSGFEPPTVVGTVELTLDRAHYQPGDPVRVFGVATTASGQPMTSVQLRMGTMYHTVRPASDGSFEVQFMATSDAAIEAWLGADPSTPDGEHWSVVALVPIGQSSHTERLSVFSQNDGLVVELLADDGITPIEGVQISVQIDGGNRSTQATDGRGQIVLPSAKRVKAEVVGRDGIWADWQADSVNEPAPSVWLPQVQFHPGAAVTASVFHLPENASVVVSRLWSRVVPERGALEAFRGFPVEAGRPTMGAEEEVWRSSVGEETIELPNLEPGHYRIWVVGAVVSSTAVDFWIDTRGPQLSVEAAELQLGQELVATIGHASGLVTVSDGRALRFAGVLSPGEQIRLQPAWDWSEQLEVCSSAPQVRQCVPIALEPTLDVALVTHRVAEGWQVEVVVTDGAQHPVQATVLVRGNDVRVPAGLRWAELEIQGFAPANAHVLSEGWTRGFVGVQRSIDAALVAEAERDATSEQLAAGLFGTSNLSKTQAAYGAGGLGLGAGQGGGGVGRGLGSGVFGARGLANRQQAQAYFSEAAAWKVLRTGADGRARYVTPLPPVRTQIELSAVAVSAHGRGRARTVFDTRALPHLVASMGGPGVFGDRIQPIATVVAGAEPFVGLLRVGADEQKVELEPGRAQRFELGTVEVGEQVEVEVEGIGRRTVAFDALLLPPAVDGELLFVMAGTEGLPFDRLLESPLVHRQWRARAALAALAGATGRSRARLLSMVRESVPQDSIEAVLLAAAVHRARASGTDVPTAAPPTSIEELQNIGNRITGTGYQLVGLRARAESGALLDPVTLARLVRDVDQLPPEAIGNLALAFIASGQAERARALPLSSDQDLLQLLAKKRLGLPLPSRVDRMKLWNTAHPAAWIELVSEHADAPGQITVQGAKTSVKAGRSMFVEAGVFSVSGPVLAFPVRAELPASPVAMRSTPYGDTLECGIPCLLEVGDHLSSGYPVQGPWRTGGWASQEGSYSAVSAWAQTPYQSRVSAVNVRVGPLEPTRGKQLMLARQAAAAGSDPRLSLPGWRGWVEGSVLRASLPTDAAAVVFAWTESQQDPLATVEAFEILRQGSGALGLEDILRVARAYRALEQHGRARAIYRAGLSSSFEALSTRVATLTGSINSVTPLQLTRRLTGDFPPVDSVVDVLAGLPDKLDEVGENLSAASRRKGITPDLVTAMAATWNLEYIAIYGDSPRAHESAVTLVDALNGLRRFDAAGRWAKVFAERYQGSPSEDALWFARGLALADAGQVSQAQQAFARVAERVFVGPDRTTGPSALRHDAEYGIAMLHEARGDVQQAMVAYERLAKGTSPVSGSAEAALDALRNGALVAPERVVLGLGDPIEMTVEAANVSSIDLSVYRIDLRTAFLREKRFEGVREVNLNGVSPVATRRIPVRRSSLVTEVKLRLPVRKPGAYLIVSRAGAVEQKTLVVRSNLHVARLPGGRLSVSRQGRPAVGVQLRGISGSSVTVAQTDVRGIADIDTNEVLVYDGAHFGLLTQQDTQVGREPSNPAPAVDIRQNYDNRIRHQKRSNRQLYESQMDADEAMEMNML